MSRPPHAPHPTIIDQVIITSGALHRELSASFKQLIKVTKRGARSLAFHLEVSLGCQCSRQVEPGRICRRSRLQVCVRAERQLETQGSTRWESVPFIDMGDSLGEWNTSCAQALPLLKSHLLRLGRDLQHCAELLNGIDQV